MDRQKIKILAIVLLVQFAVALQAQILPKYIEVEIKKSGLEYFDRSGMGYDFVPGESYPWFDFDYKLTSQGQDVMVRVDPPGEERYFDMAITIRSIAQNSRRVEINKVATDSPLAQVYQVKDLWVADFEPRAFFRRSRCQLIYFFSDAGALVRIGTFYNSDLEEEVVLRNRMWTY